MPTQFKYETRPFQIEKCTHAAMCALAKIEGKNPDEQVTRILSQFIEHALGRELKDKVIAGMKEFM